MSATASTDTATTAEQLRQDILSAMEGDYDETRAKRIYNGLTTQWGLPETLIGEGGRTGVPLSTIKRKAVENPDFLEERYGDANIFLKAMAAGPRYDESAHEIRAVEEATTRSATPDGERALVDNSVVGAATPVEVDPRIVDIQRKAAPILYIITAQSQPGFTAQYNIISGRDAPVGFLSESEAAGDLESQFTPQSFTLDTATKDMKIQVGLVKVSDFAQRAEQTLDYMDLRQTSLGQATIAHSLQKARAIFYGDPSGTDPADLSIEDADAYEGMAKIFDDAGNSIDKSGSSSGFLKDMLDEVTVQVENTGLTWDRARYLVSPRMYNAIYDEITPVVRVDGYDADVEYGPQGLAIGTEMGSVGITPCPNIRSYSGFSKTASNSDPGDVFLVDEMAVQFRQLAPLSTVPLGRTGLADRVALFEFGTLIDKSHGNHGLWLQGYDI
ncbi:hypothetical protein BRC81_02995 [Halobacteriales archaeon QS_1_68_20]|nr:MAG: hypothetical protein BRC81_02995 [Halobacteriales archaeon QS_1_68_20]